MDEEEVFSADELEGKIVVQFERIISKLSPARDIDSYPREIKWHGVVVSPRPGNLRDNGNVRVKTANGYMIKHGYRPAPYALYANKTSRKPGYIQAALNKFKSFLIQDGWEEE